MNLLDPDRNRASQQYVVEFMRKSNLQNVSSTIKTKTKKTSRISGRKLIITILITIFSLTSTVISLLNSTFVVNADRINPSNKTPTVLGESTALSPSTLVPRVKKSAISSYIMGDTRVIALKRFLEIKRSPMAEYADVIVREADAIGMDYRLLASISGIESDFGRITTRRQDGQTGNSYNAWGWFKGWMGNINRFREFSSWTDSITLVTKGIARGYGNNPSPAVMQDIYCASCREAGSDNWSISVIRYMNEIKNMEANL